MVDRIVSETRQVGGRELAELLGFDTGAKACRIERMDDPPNWWEVTVYYVQSEPSGERSRDDDGGR